MFRECFSFNCKVNLKNLMFLLAAAVSIVFSVISQLPYFEHYQLASPSDIQAISDRMWIDSTVPTYGEERIQLTTDHVRDSLTNVLKLQNSSGIIADLKARLSIKTDWTVDELDAVWAEMTEEHDELKMLMPNHLSNAFLNNFRKTVTRDELFQYAYSKNDFSYYLSVEFGESLALIVSILFVVFFSTLFLGDVKQGMSDILHINTVSPRKMIYAKYLSAPVMVTGCVCLDILTVNIMQLLYCKDITPGQLLIVWGGTLLYCIPTIVFLSSVSVFLCVLFRNAILGVAALLLFNFVSSCHYVLPDGSREQFPAAPFLFNLNSFFDPISRNQFLAIILNRTAFCLIGAAILELTLLIWKKRKSIGAIRVTSKTKAAVSSLFSPKCFFFYNVKIILSKVKLAAVFIIFALPYISINANTDITNVSRSILLMTGWASVILFSNIKSVEYADNTIDPYRLSAKGKAAVGIRFLICVITILFFTSAVFFLGLLRINPMTYNLEHTAQIFVRMTVSCLTCSCFLGSAAMTAGHALKKTWAGIAVGLVVNILLSQIKANSIFNLYLFYHFPDNENILQWIMSVLFFALLSLAIILYNIFRTGKTFRFSKA